MERRITLGDLVHKSVFGTIATVKDEFSIRKLNLFLEYNLPLLYRFSKVILAVNKADGVSDVVYKKYLEFWRMNIPHTDILELEHNRGHMFGTIDLEEEILRHVKESYPEIEYLFKSMDDVITSELLLDLEVPEADFYYLPGFSYESIIKAGSKKKLLDIYENFESTYWTPQTTFYIVRINDITSLYGNDIGDKYNVYTNAKKEIPSIKPWEILFDIKFDCETHLGRTVKDFRKHCLISDKFEQLLDLVEKTPIGDPAHKNIYFKDIGVCHYHFYDSPVYEI